MNENQTIKTGPETISLRSGANLKVGDRFLYQGNREIKEVKPKFNFNTIILDGGVEIELRHRDIFEYNHHDCAWMPMSPGVVGLINKAAPQQGETQEANSSRMFMSRNCRCFKELKPIEIKV